MAKKTPVKKLIVYIIIILIAILGNIYFYFQNSKKDKVAFNSDIISTIQVDDGSLSMEGVGGDSKPIYEHDVFIILKKVGDWPIVPDNIGKANPFAPTF